MKKLLDNALDFALVLFETYSENSEYASNKTKVISEKFVNFQLYLSY